MCNHSDFKDFVTPIVSLILGIGSMIFSYKQISIQVKKNRKSGMPIRKQKKYK